MGDGVLRDVARIVTRTMRSTDIVCRYRDDEFLVLLTDTDATGAQIAANRVRDAMAAHDFFKSQLGDPVKLTASTGVAYWEPADKNATWEPSTHRLSPSAPSAPPRCPAPIAWLCSRHREHHSDECLARQGLPRFEGRTAGEVRLRV